MKTKKSSFFRGLVVLSAAYFFLVGMNSVWGFASGLGSIRVTVDTEIDNLGAAVHKGNATVKIKCAGGTGSYSVTDQTASDSNTTSGIIDIASNTAGFSGSGKAGCDTNAEWMAASVSLDGFVTATISRSFTNIYSTTALNSGLSSISFTVHVNGVKDELGNTLTLDGTTASITYLGGTATVSYKTGVAYISVSPNDVSPIASAGANGYVNQQVALSSIVSTASKSVIFQTGGSATFVGAGLPTAYKFNVYACCGTAPLTGSGVTAGNSNTIGCNASGAVYYCAVPASHTGTSARATKAGYNNGTLTYVLRTRNHDSQITGNIYPVLNSSNGGGSSIISTPTPTPTPIASVPISSPIPSPTVSGSPTPTSSTTPSNIYVPLPTPVPVSVKLFRKAKDPKVYVQKSDGTVSWVKTLDEFNSAGYRWSDIKQISGKDFAKLVTSSKLRVKSGIKLNVRDGTSPKAKIIGRISSGEVYEKKGTIGAWFKIMTTDGREGWINSAYVSEE